MQLSLQYSYPDSKPYKTQSDELWVVHGKALCFLVHEKLPTRVPSDGTRGMVTIDNATGSSRTHARLSVLGIWVSRSIRLNDIF